MATIDTDKLTKALGFLRESDEGAKELAELRSKLDGFVNRVPGDLSYPEGVTLLRILMSDLRLDEDPDSIGNVVRLQDGGVISSGFRVDAQK